MARKIWTRTAFVLMGISFVGCKTGPEKEPLRLDSLFNRQSQSSTPSPVGSQGPTSSFSMKQSAKDYFTDSRKAASVPETSTFGRIDDDTKPSIRQAATAVKDALTIEPRVVRTADPTALAHDPGKLQPKLYLTAAALHEQQGQLSEAAEKYQRLLAIDPSNREGLVGLGRLRHRQGDLEGAIEVYSSAAKQYGDDPIVLNDLGLCLARAGRSDEAVEHLQTAIRLKPGSLLYRNNLAAVLVESDRSIEAVTALEQSYGPAVAHYNVGYLLKQQGKNQDATAHFTEALNINPSLEPARQMLEQTSPQIGTLPQHLRQKTPQVPLRTSSVEPIADPSVRPAVASTVVPYAPEATSALEPLPATPIQDVALVDPAMPQSYVAPAAFEVPLEEPIAPPEMLETESAEGLIRLPVPRKPIRPETSLVAPSPVDLEAARRPGFLPIAE